MDWTQYGTTDGCEWSLCLVISQIVEGTVKCAGCKRDAVMFLANGADPEDVPYCSQHGQIFIRNVSDLLLDLFPRQIGEEAA
jgi:hypothetical protein